jgi:hypothetical protein
MRLRPRDYFYHVDGEKEVGKQYFTQDYRLCLVIAMRVSVSLCTRDCEQGNAKLLALA